MTLTRLAAALAALFALGACSMAPKLEQPALTTAIPDNLRSDIPWTTAPDAVPMDALWWRRLNDPLLAQWQDELLKSNPSIELSLAQYRAARAAVDSADAALWPTLNLSASQTRSQTGSASRATGVATAVGTTTSYATAVQAAWELDLWGRLRNDTQAAQGDLASAAAVVGNARLSAQALLAQSVVLWRVAMAQEALLDRSVQAYARFKDLTQLRFEAGVASRLDVAQANTLLNNTRTRLAEATLVRTQSENAIAAVLGRVPASMDWAAMAQRYPVFTGQTIPDVPAPPELLSSTVLQGRYDVLAAQARVKAANARIGVARAAYFPVISLAASSGYRSTVLSNLFDTPARVWSVGPALALNLFDAGARSAAVEAAFAQMDQAVATYRQTVVTAFQEVEDNLAAVKLLEREQQSQAQALESAWLARDIAQAQYTAGTADSLNVISTQVSALDAEATAITLWGRRMVALINLLKNTSGQALQAESASVGRVAAPAGQ